ncbi:calcium permeable stress-gated cation channel, partial [Phenoliferia sp. Uapishka_3]
MEFVALLLDEEETPGLPPSQIKNYRGPWFSNQLGLSLTIGILSFLVFSFLRRVEKWRVLYSPRTLLKGFSPHEVHDKRDTYFGWVLPTLRTSEFTVLQIVGLDAAVLLSFFRTAFLFFLTCTFLAAAILVPINYRENGTTEGVEPPPYNETSFAPQSFKPIKINPAQGSTIYLSSHLAFTYLFSILALYFLQRNYSRYIPLRQLFSLELAHSVPARTVMVTALPPHLRSERALAEYFEGIHLGASGDSEGLSVESVTVVRAVGGMKELLEQRTKALRDLEIAWSRYLGNPVPIEGPKAVFGYIPAAEVERINEESPSPSVEEDDVQDTTSPMDLRSGGREGRLVEIDGEGTESRGGPLATPNEDDLEARLLTPSRATIINPSRKRPTFRPTWFGKKVDALDWYAEKFRSADELVRKRRQGKFRPTGVAFITFESLAAAQIAAQTVHYPSATSFRTELAPEPRDVQWFNLSLSASSVFVRQLLVVLTFLLFLSVWSIPVAYLAKLLSWDTIQESAPKLAKWIAKSPRLQAFVQTSLPSLAMVSFNNFLPFFLEGGSAFSFFNEDQVAFSDIAFAALSVFQGLPARSWIEYSLLKKYHISILFTTLFVFITSSTYSLLSELSESPASVLNKLATTLPGARNFFVSYVMLSGLAIMPLQLLELAVVIPRFFYAIFARTPRDHAELNAPPMLNLGTVYPQALLIFTLGLTYSIISPLILPFATLYFGLAYLVYKYKLLFVYYRPYESRGQAWPLAFNRISWALIIFQGFMGGLLLVRKAFLLSGLVVPLLAATAYSTWKMHAVYAPLSRYVNLSQACEVSHGSPSDIIKLRRGHPVTRSQSNLQRARYAHNDEGVYVVGKNPHTDYSQPPMSESFPGVLNQGRKRYGHPALSGSLPEPWLPVLEDPAQNAEVPDVVKAALVMDLRRRWSTVKRAARKGVNVVPGINIRERSEGSSSGVDLEDPAHRAWRGGEPSPIENDWDEMSEEDDELEDGSPGMTRYALFFGKSHGDSGTDGDDLDTQPTGIAAECQEPFRRKEQQATQRKIPGVIDISNASTAGFDSDLDSESERAPHYWTADEIADLRRLVPTREDALRMGHTGGWEAVADKIGTGRSWQAVKSRFWREHGRRQASTTHSRQRKLKPQMTTTPERKRQRMSGAIHDLEGYLLKSKFNMSQLHRARHNFEFTRAGRNRTVRRQVSALLKIIAVNCPRTPSSSTAGETTQRALTSRSTITVTLRMRYEVVPPYTDERVNSRRIQSFTAEEVEELAIRERLDQANLDVGARETLNARLKKLKLICLRRQQEK